MPIDVWPPDPNEPAMLARITCPKGHQAGPMFRLSEVRHQVDAGDPVKYYCLTCGENYELTLEAQNALLGELEAAQRLKD